MSAPAITQPTANVREFSTELVVRKRSAPAEGVAILDLVAPDGQDLPRWEPGAHIDLVLGGGLTRQYSLCGDPHDSSVWRVGVLLDPNSRGGSRYVHENLCEGAVVEVRGPRNNFPMVDSPHYRFIAGGIGITPILTMIQAAQRSGAEWTLLYGGRTRGSMAFTGELTEQYPQRVTVWPQDEFGLLDLASLFKSPEDNTLVYCCGPEPLLAAVEQHSAHWPAGTLHIERFAAKDRSGEQAGDALDRFEVVCQRSGVSIEIAEHQSILEVLQDEGIPIMGSCFEGVCGTCQVRVLQGEVDHRDSVLSDAEQAAGEVMMTCVSRSRSERLVLDL